MRGLNALLATVTTTGTAPVIVAQRLRKGSCGSPRGAKRLVADALKTSAAAPPAEAAAAGRLGVLRGGTVGAAVRAGRRCLGHRPPGPQGQGRDRHHRRGRVDPIEYTDAVFDEATGTWVSRAEVAEVPFTAFTSDEGRPGARAAGGAPHPRPQPGAKDGQGTLFDTWRFHAFFTTTDPADLDTVAADKTHRGHAIIEQVHADLKSSALAHLPSGKFTANAAWLVLAVIAFNLTRAAAALTGTDLAKATTATIRRKLITVPARVASSARRITLHLPTAWPWDTAWTRLFTHGCGPPTPATT